MFCGVVVQSSGTQAIFKFMVWCLGIGATMISALYCTIWWATLIMQFCASSLSWTLHFCFNQLCLVQQEKYLTAELTEQFLTWYSGHTGTQQQLVMQSGEESIDEEWVKWDKWDKWVVLCWTLSFRRSEEISDDEDTKVRIHFTPADNRSLFHRNENRRFPCWPGSVSKFLSRTHNIIRKCHQEYSCH
jgi:hypothetical protein